MVSNQVLGARTVAGLLILSVALFGCSHAQHQDQAAAAPTPVTANQAAAQAQAAPPEMTATEAAISASPAPASAAVVTRDAVNPSAPMHYTVKRGDTLWGIASMYLKDPWLWPEVWVINPQIPNPHLIYPGDQLALAYGADGRPSVRVEQAGEVRLDPRLRSTPLLNAIPTIPYSAISAFLGRPTVISEEEVKHAPYVLGFRDMHQAAGSNQTVYIRNLSAVENSRYAIVHIAGPLRDPDDNKLLGYEAIYAATALVERPGEPTKALLIDPARETLAGDRLLSAEDTETPVTFTPHAPASNVRGRIIDRVAGTDLIGLYDVVVLNRGTSQGLDAGAVLAVDMEGDVVPDIYRGGRNIGSTGSLTFAPKVKLPNERNGTLLVFKTYARVSYALVIGADDYIQVGDVVHNP
jgi:LysM repeat protein